MRFAVIVPAVALCISCSTPSVAPDATPDAIPAAKPDGVSNAPPRKPPAAKRVSMPVPAAALDAAGVRGGVAVFIGGNAGPAAKLGANGAYLVHFIDTERARVEKAREGIKAEGAYGNVSADVHDGARLPYVDNMVNLVVDQRSDAAGPSAEAFASEIARVLAPRGIYLAPKAFAFGAPGFSSEAAGEWTAHRKPVPENIDEWTHFLHGPGNNAVARDSVVGPPKHMQWVGSPRYGRHHDKMSSITAVVSAAGRVFYIEDRASPFSVLTAPEWRLTARDAFNGTVLWRRKVDKWFDDLHPHKSGPAHLPRKLVAEGDRVYVTLAIDGPALALDAATGETLRTFEGSAPADELMHCAGVLFVRQEKGLVAFDSASGERLWETDMVPVRGSLALDARHAAFLLEDRIVCLDRKTGRERWRSEPVPRPKSYPIRSNPILILYEDVVLFAGGEKSVGHRDHQGNYSWKVGIDDTITALAASTGKVLWTAPHPLSGYASSEDLFVIDGVVWCGETTSGHAVGHFAGRDVRTGKVVKEFDPDVKTYWFHHRCHRGKATEKYILTSRTGTEFIDLKTGHWDINHWVRGACLYGLMPTNGLLYSPQNPCACFLENRMLGFNALAHSRMPVPETASAPRLRKGSAYAGAETTPLPKLIASDAWPTYRGNNGRSGSTDAAVPARLASAWAAKVGGRLSAPTVAAGRVFVVSIDRHEVLALDEADGHIVWRHTAGARVDSPPTIHAPGGQRGALCIFGARDGTITCLRASDGMLVWRFRAARASTRSRTSRTNSASTRMAASTRST